jgi:4-cresol dehydrogenase (hydroxylating) flavoprotein subunit
MKLILPPRMSARKFDAALRAFERVVGSHWVLATDEDRDSYSDAYAPGNADSYAPAAGVAPADVDQLRALLQIANEYRLPLWPVSRGKNLGHGGTAPALAGTVVLDLSRMKKIIEVDAQLGYCLVEPGVGFYDMADHLRANRIPLWMSVPGNGWGSLVGNALDRGFSHTPYGEHAAMICGMEVMLPDGELLRTGMGAMTAGNSWQLARYGFGPAWDQVFVQSNFGIVTKLGLWLMPEPESTMSMSLQLAEHEDIGWAIETLAQLRLRGVLQHDPNIGNGLRAAALLGQRDEWYRGAGAMPADAVQELLQKLDLGAWNFALRLYGNEGVVQANAKLVKNAIAPHSRAEFRVASWHQGEPLAGSGAGAPGVGALGNANWRGGRGGQMGFAPISPPTRAHALRQYQMASRRYAESGFDYLASFTLRDRHLVHATQCIYDRDDQAMTRNARELLRLLIDDHAAAGYGEQRAHVNHMDQIARSYDFNDHALLRLNERFKDLVDPNGILAPGKSGIWPRALRDTRRRS